jgi:LysM repeat protein
MKNILTILLTFCISLVASASPTEKTPQEKYIEKYAPLAVSEMYRSGVPASITLAQGLLESGNGQSELARKSNNHFGIKCHNNWQGGRVYHDDDAKGECFRKYSDPSDSYRDHSDFLRFRDRYKFLFDYRVTDYKSWAHGLKKAGYATDPAYPKKLIKLIEEYDLNQYDRKPASFGRSYNKKESKQTPSVESKQSKNEPAAQKQTTENPSKEKSVKSKQKPVKEQELPLAPSVIEQVKELDEKQAEVFHFSLARKIYTQNNVPFVYSEEGDTYATIAASHNLFMREILKFNDLKNDSPLAPGTVVYLKPKKKSAAKGVDKYVFEDGDDLREVAQRFGVRLASVVRMNGFEEGAAPREGDIIRLR